MKIQRASFNSYLVLAALLISSLCGAAQNEKTRDEQNQKKQASTLRLFLEVNQNMADHGQQVPLFRAKPVKVNVEKEEFLSEGNVDQASVLDQDGVVLIKVQFDKRGSWLLENITASNSGKRIAIFSQFTEARWLAAPLISKRIGDGVLIFTPDANRQEADRIVRGLNNVAAKAKKLNKF
jgi:preprotein translocase subunit SecD